MTLKIFWRFGFIFYLALISFIITFVGTLGLITYTETIMVIITVSIFLVVGRIAGLFVEYIDEKLVEGKYRKALEYYSNEIESNPYFASAYNDRGNVRYILDDYIGAKSDYNKAIELDPNFTQAYNNLGIVKMYIDGLSTAEPYYNKSIELDSSYTNAYFNRGLMHYCRSEFGKSIKDFEKCTQLNPKDAQAFYYCGLSRIGNGDENLGKHDIKNAKILGITVKEELYIKETVRELKLLEKNKK